MTKREELLQIAMDMPEEKAAVAIDAIKKALEPEEPNGIRLFQVEQGGKVSVLHIPAEEVD